MVIFHCYVSLPEGTVDDMKLYDTLCYYIKGSTGKKYEHMVANHNLETFVRSLTDMGLSLIHDGWLGVDTVIGFFFLKRQQKMVFCMTGSPLYPIISP